MKSEEIIQKINGFLIDEFEVEEDKLSPDAQFKRDLGIDSLDFVDIAVIIESNFGFKVKGEEMTNILTLQNFYDYIISKVGAN